MQWIIIAIIIGYLGFLMFKGTFKWFNQNIENLAENLAKAGKHKRYKDAHDAWVQNQKLFNENIRAENLKKTEDARLEYQKNLEAWNQEVNKQKKKETSLHKQWTKQVANIKSNWEKNKLEQLDLWKNLEEADIKKHNQQLEKIKQFKQSYLNSEISAIEKYVSKVIEHHHQEYKFPSSNTVHYLEETSTIVIDCSLPSPKQLPTLKEVKYIKSKNSLQEIHLTETSLNKLYDNVIYQLCLADINKTFNTDTINAIQTIIFNGWVTSIDKSTGHEVNTCILSTHVQKDTFEKIILNQVDAKECFKHLKGVGSSKLHSITPISPIMKISMEDNRFIEAYDVAHTLNEGVNIAAMDWQDFEHLVREVFQKMLSNDGMTVKVTQSSRDKGVDAIAIDPDPVRGGKIVIQAKRYTNVVGVSAVRDLYGTVMNEGAMKGILVTTANFGNDAYEFVKGKPLTLISGGELLSLLANNGYKAKIDLKEAKKVLGITV